MTMIICSKVKCIHGSAYKDGTRRCSCTAIGVDENNECDSYLELPEFLSKKLEGSFDED